MLAFVANEKKYYSLMSQIFVSFCRRCIPSRKRLFKREKIIVPSPIPIPFLRRCSILNRPLFPFVFSAPFKSGGGAKTAHMGKGRGYVGGGRPIG